MLSNVLGFLGKNWQAVVLVVVVVIGYGWIRHQQAGFADTLAKLNADHQAEIDKINSARALEDQQHAQELKQLQDTMAHIQADYEAAQAQLVERQTEEQKQIVKRYGTDMNGLAKLVADRFGFVVVQPQ